jgi:superoxide dismutase, Cu-Zn family
MTHRLLMTALSAALVATACASGQPDKGGPTAMAELQSTTGNTATGRVNFVQTGGKVTVSGSIRGLKPNTAHGFHVHEKGDCSSGDGMSAGGHFNPDAKPHGDPGTAAHHAGDFPSLTSDGAGVATFSFETTTIAVGSGTGDVVGKGLIVHSDPDDYMTQPTGNSGARLACAVIVKS